MPLCITLNQNVVAFSFYAKMLHEKLHKNYKYVFPPLNLTCSFRCFNSIFDDPLISEWQYLFSYKISANDLQRSFLNSFTQFIVQWNPYLTYLWVFYSPWSTPIPWEEHPLLHINTLIYSHFVVTSYIFWCCIHRAPYYPYVCTIFLKLTE